MKSAEPNFDLSVPQVSHKIIMVVNNIMLPRLVIYHRDPQRYNVAIYLLSLYLSTYYPIDIMALYIVTAINNKHKFKNV